MKMANDEMVNHHVEDVGFKVESNDDYQALRNIWTTMPKIPKLVDGHECRVILDVGGVVIRSLLKGEESAGTLAVMLVKAEAGAAGATDHHQPLEDEFWFALQGEWEWSIGDATLRAGPGSFAYAPRNTTHAFRNVGSTAALMFTVNTPAGHERGFQELHRLVSEESPPAAIQESFARHDFVFHP